MLSCQHQCNANSHHEQPAGVCFVLRVARNQGRASPPPPENGRNGEATAARGREWINATCFTARRYRTHPPAAAAVCFTTCDDRLLKRKNCCKLLFPNRLRATEHNLPTSTVVKQSHAQMAASEVRLSGEIEAASAYSRRYSFREGTAASSQPEC